MMTACAPSWPQSVCLQVQQQQQQHSLAMSMKLQSMTIWEGSGTYLHL
jgi:hypothetical protein